MRKIIIVLLANLTVTFVSLKPAVQGKFQQIVLNAQQVLSC